MKEIIVTSLLVVGILALSVMVLMMAGVNVPSDFWQFMALIVIIIAGVIFFTMVVHSDG